MSTLPGQIPYDSALPHCNPWDFFEATESQRAHEVCELIQSEECLEWLSCEALADDKRVATSCFGWISPTEMFRLALKPDSTPEQCKAVFTELRQRFAASRRDDIEERAKARAMRDAEEHWL